MKKRFLLPDETGSNEQTNQASTDMMNVSKETLNQIRAGAESLIATQPAISVAIALAVGLGMGWWVKRK